MTYRITKTYGHELGLSACFRQWRASSHCRFLHGYPLSFKFTFESDKLDENNWVLDFGGLKPLKAWLAETFDHKLVVAADDPQRNRLIALSRTLNETAPSSVERKPPVADVLVVPFVGCEGFAKLAYEAAVRILYEQHGSASPLLNGVRLVEVEVREHGGNSAIYMGDR